MFKWNHLEQPSFEPRCFESWMSCGILYEKVIFFMKMDFLIYGITYFPNVYKENT